MSASKVSETVVPRLPRYDESGDIVSYLEGACILQIGTVERGGVKRLALNCKLPCGTQVNITIGFSELGLWVIGKRTWR